MKYRHPLREILNKTRSHWDRDQASPAARWAFDKALLCQTAELGAEIYIGEEDELVVYLTCKSRACPSCGYRANVQWLRERWAALPDAIYKGITFTMPDVLWPVFRDNPHLSQALSRTLSAHGSQLWAVRTAAPESNFGGHLRSLGTEAETAS